MAEIPVTTGVTREQFSTRLAAPYRAGLVEKQCYWQGIENGIEGGRTPPGGLARAVETAGYLARLRFAYVEHGSLDRLFQQPAGNKMEGTGGKLSG
jgi:hypothetical protein